MKFAKSGIAAAVLLSGLGLGCSSSHQEGVKSNLHTQWTDVYADVKTTTSAAEKVFKDDELTDVSSQATQIDGEASGVSADKTKIWASVKKTDKGSQLSVQVGKVGSPKRGAEYAAKIKQIAEGKK